eukprot:m.703195 g.703195  ORF g.703195 m.703195 type:complete len:676 (-) comp58714_c0_seq16:2672-4699(-)
MAPKPDTARQPAPAPKPAASAATAAAAAVKPSAGASAQPKAAPATKPPVVGPAPVKPAATKPKVAAASPAKNAAPKVATAPAAASKPKAAATTTKPAAAAKAAKPAATKTTTAKAAKSGPVRSEAEVRRENAAVCIQCCVRQFLSRRRLAKERARKAEYEALMVKQEREAWLYLVKREREEEEKRQAVERERLRKLKEQKKQEASLREAAFEGDVDALQKLLKLSDINIDCTDANGETPLLEAAGGGQVEAIKVLAQNGADVNARGNFQRTPLFRASFAGHSDAANLLLTLGGDPRLYDTDGATPADIAANDATKLVLANWKLEETDRLLAQIAKVKDAKRAKEAALRLQATQSIEKQIEEAARMDTVRQTELKRSYLEYEKRISEHDRTVRKNLEERLVSLTLQMVKDAELELEKAKIAAQEARDALQQAKMKLREQHELENKERNPGESSRPKCNFRELDDVVMRDVGDKLAAQPAWPMLIDFSRQVSTFLRYRDTNYINACSPHDTEPERIRMAILGALRFGKALVIDLMDVELWNTLPLIFNAVQPRLFEDIVSKNLVKKQTFKTLLKAKDGEEYKPANFSDARIGKFRTIFITTQRFPDADMLAATYALEVLPSPPVNDVGVAGAVCWRCCGAVSLLLRQRRASSVCARGCRPPPRCGWLFGHPGLLHQL